MIDKMKHENVLHVLINITNNKTRLSDSNLAKEVLKNFNQIPDLSIEKLSENCYVSQPTMTRFIKKLGYKNYAQFKRHVTSVSSINNSETVEDLYNINSEDIVGSHLSKVINSLTETANQVDQSQFTKACKDINEANRLAIVGIDYSQVVAFDTQLRFARYDKLLETAVSSKEQLDLIESLKEEDILIILSVSGVTKGLANVVKYLEPGVRCILITSNPNPSILNCHSNTTILNISTIADQKTSTSQTGRLNLLFAIDLLYITYGQLYFDN